MKGKFRVIWSVSLALVLALSFSLVMPLPNIVSASPEKLLYVDDNAILDGTVASYNGTSLELVATSAAFAGYNTGDAVEFISGTAKGKVTTIATWSANTTVTLVSNVGAAENDTFNLVDLDAPSAGDPFRYIQSAITIASPGDTINVAAGTYTENLVIGKALTLQSSGGAATTTINATDNQTYVVKIMANNVTLNGFTITGRAGGASPNDAAVITWGVDNSTITNNTLTGNYPVAINLFGGASESPGVYSDNNTVSNNVINAPNGQETYGIKIKGSHNTISGNQIYNADTSIHIWSWDAASETASPDSNIISGNTIAQGTGGTAPHKYGIEIKTGRSNQVTGNTISVTRAAIHLYTSDRMAAETSFDPRPASANISGNIITGGEVGICLLEGARTNIISGNVITGTTKAGILGSLSRWPTDWSGKTLAFTNNANYLDYLQIVGNTISSNTITNSGHGIAMAYGDDNILNYNTIQGNTSVAAIDYYGVAFTADAGGVYFDANSSGNVAKNNWWGAITGPRAPDSSSALGDKVSANVDYTPWLNAAYPGGTPRDYNVLNTNTSAKFNSIGLAIADGGTLGGHTLSVLAGTYSGNITINKAIALVSAAGSANTTIDASGLGANAVTIASANVTLGRVGAGFTITGANTIGLSGIVLGGSNSRIDSNNITGNQHGIWVTGTQNRVIRNTITANSGHGIRLPGTTEWNDVTYNDITNNGFGIYAEQVPGQPYWMQWAGFNYWGDASGPGGSGPGAGDEVNQYVWYNPWLNTSYSTNLAEGIANISMAIPLQVGWNTLSTPLALAAGSIQWNNIVTRSTLTYDMAVVFNATTKGFEGLSANSTMALNPLDAVFIKVSADQKVSLMVSISPNAPPTRPLKAGWNLIGAAMSITDRELEMWKVLVSVDKTPAGLIGYDMVVSPPLATQPPWVYVRGQKEADPTYKWEKMDFGRGYWIYMENADEFAGFSSTPITARVWD